MEHGGLLELKEGARSPKRAKWLEFSEETPNMRKLYRERTPKIFSIWLSTEECVHENIHAHEYNMHMASREDIPGAHVRPRTVPVPTNLSEKPHNSWGIW